MEIRIRRAGAGDLENLVHHRRAMFEEMGYRDARVLAAVDDASRQYFSQALKTGGYVGWVEEELTEQKVVGGGGLVVAAWPGFPGESRAERAWILNMYTEPEARRQGVAKNLLAVITEWCRTQGFSIVSLHASTAGQPLYKTFGFQPTNEMRLKLR